ncbi:hypothetical protein [Kitasatospora sp. NPDC056531]|uniref:hypothetical protein n=1 Tax=Kitasatospora sp. NPDC056531 TaxID=3345856 RepID=UPI00367FA521
MTGISFTPTFHHTDWRDNVDRVQAAGSNGFNTRFNALESDLKAVSTVVGAIDQAITALSTHPPTAPKVISLTPLLTSADGGTGWGYDPTTGVARGQALGRFTGLMNVPVPDGAQLASLRVVAANSSAVAHLTVTFNRIPLVLVASSAPDQLAKVSVGTSPFDATFPVVGTVAQVDLARFRYYLVADVQGATAADVITLSGFQITYTS